MAAANEQVEQLTAAAAEAAANGAGNENLAQDLETALEQRNAAQKKVSQLKTTVKKLTSAVEAAKIEVIYLPSMRGGGAAVVLME